MVEAPLLYLGLSRGVSRLLSSMAVTGKSRCLSLQLGKWLRGNGAELRPVGDATVNQGS